MSWLAAVALSILHFLYACTTTIVSWKARLSYSPPTSIEHPRTRVPSHLALLLAAEDYELDQTGLVREYLLESLQKATAWCKIVGIRRLTVYDRGGILSSSLEQVIRCLYADGTFSVERNSSESDIEYPLTPPSSDSGSRPLSPAKSQTYGMNVITLENPNIRPSSSKAYSRFSGVKRRRKQTRNSSESSKPLTTHIVSRLSGKPSIAQAASTLLCDANRTEKQGLQKEFCIEVDQINSVIEGNSGFPLPDLLIVHDIFPNARCRKPPMEFHGFPPWQLRLTEFYQTENSRVRRPRWWGKPNGVNTPVLLDETEFAKALDQYSLAEMRLGK